MTAELSATSFLRKYLCILFGIVFLVCVADTAVAKESLPPIPIAEGLEAPAAEMVEPGYVYSKGGDLYLDGQRIKFWGVNCVSEFWRDKEDQIRILDRIQALGFNAIRVHLIDNTIVDPAGLGYTINDYELGDDSLMDKFDYFLSEAYRRGLLVWMTLDRRRITFDPESYHILEDGEDEQEWKAAMQDFAEKPSFPAYYLEQLWPINPRLEAVYTQYVQNVMEHRNKYTGLTYAEEPGIALWEISNEGGSVIGILDGSLFKALEDYPYWKNTAEQLWNEFLRKHYEDDSMLLQAWGSLGPGESLTDGTIRLEPMPVPLETSKPNHEEAEYPSRRISDLITFVVNRYVEANNRVWQVMRDSAPAGRGASVVPVTFDTHFRPTLHNLYGVSQGSFVSVGAYKWLRTYDKSDPLYPLTSMLSVKHPYLYGMDIGNVADKPMVTYEFNIHKPAPYRAEIPYLIAAYISSNHWDGFFWYHWMTSGQPTPQDNEELLEQPIHYAIETNFWGGVVTSSDEVLVSAIRMAGEMFKSGAIREAANPVRFVVGHQQFADPNVKITPLHTPMRIAGWTRGMEIDFRPNRHDHGLAVEAPVSWPEESFRLGHDANLDSDRRQLVIDSETAHAFVGWPNESVISFSSGLKISGYPLDKFLAFSVVSKDGRPIGQSSRLLASVQGTSRNTGYNYDPLVSQDKGFPGMLQGMVSPGRAPVIINRPELTMDFPDSRHGVAHLYNAFPEQFAEQAVDGQFIFDGEQPIAWVEIYFK